MKQIKFVAAAVVAATAVLAMPAHAGETLDAVKARGTLVCGVNTGLPGFSAADSKGEWSGLDVDVCRAVAAATLGDASKVKYVPLNSTQRFTALQSGEVDMLSRNTTFTMTRDTSLGLHATGVTYYDGQGFMVPTKTKMKSAKQLKNQTVCVEAGTTTEKNLTDFSKANNLNIKTVVFESFEAAKAAFFAGRCLGYTTDASGLASVRNKDAQNPADYMILPELVSKEPLGPMVRQGDDQWFGIVKWVVAGLVEAEELGVTKANLAEMKKNDSPAIGRLLGSKDDTGKLIGLDAEWMARALAATGNYGEIFERHVGPNSPLALPRGINNLWTNGGLMYAYPVR
ncbi:MAG: amino acid ABC transporter substrate-binding protein [Burkholderiaceae bacterium]|jgi:general L-amino acid transport system substrate-binding protein|nr:amino acid ABC transporter substrate-binding protein [Burkholderiaceae bacterium]MDO7705405.1 amino acid ABC transporter substrate-binding protein [Burkholderiaceae bacterium]MDO7739803.1 amino acid ABC transporter substrate-binding protein [Burkholderiaceae bacterium]